MLLLTCGQVNTMEDPLCDAVNEEGVKLAFGLNGSYGFVQSNFAQD